MCVSRAPSPAINTQGHTIAILAQLHLITMPGNGHSTFGSKGDTS